MKVLPEGGGKKFLFKDTEQAKSSDYLSTVVKKAREL